LQGRPEVEVLNPGREITIDRLEEGLWYWTIEAQTSDGHPVNAGPPGQLRVLPVPLLPSPGNLLPAMRQKIGLEDLRLNQSINFSWSKVEGAEAYIFSIFLETPSGPRLLVSTGHLDQPGYVFKDLKSLEHRGTYIWRTEGIAFDDNGAIIQRGQPGESSFIMDVPLPDQIQTKDMGVLYGN
jgi:hypothetical protein